MPKIAAASQDSEESTSHNESPLDKSSSADEESNNRASKQHSAVTTILASANINEIDPNDGHRNTLQRRIYLALLGVSVASALTGLILILIWVYSFNAVPGIGLLDAGQLSNLHVVMMYTFMVSLNMYAVLIYRTHYQQPKSRLKWAHAILSGVNVVMAILGILAMVKSHNMKNLPNFYSLHSWIGTGATAFYLVQFIAGFVAFLRPGIPADGRAKLMPWHRAAGAFLLVLGSVAATTGIVELAIFQGKPDYFKFAPITFIANFAGLSIILMATVSVYLLSAPRYLRRNSNEG